MITITCRMRRRSCCDVERNPLLSLDASEQPDPASRNADENSAFHGFRIHDLWHTSDRLAGSTGEQHSKPAEAGDVIRWMMSRGHGPAPLL